VQVLEQELRLVLVRVRVQEQALRLVLERVQVQAQAQERVQERVQRLVLVQALRLVQERCASMRARRCSRARLRA
jgi:hypothetical protein